MQNFFQQLLYFTNELLAIMFSRKPAMVAIREPVYAPHTLSAPQYPDSKEALK